SIVLIASTIIIQRQLQYIQHTNPGYDRSQIFTFRLPRSVITQNAEDQFKVTADDIKQQLLAYPAITGVSFASQSIVGLGSSNTGSAKWDGKDPDFNPQVFQLVADEAFKTTMQLEMALGRWFDPLQPTDRHNFILNQTAVNEFDIRQPVIGQRFLFQGDTGRIIGVVKDFHYASMHKQIGPLVIYNRPSGRPLIYVKTAPGKTTEALTAAHTIWSQFLPDKPFAYTFLDDTFDNLYKADTRTCNLILIFSVIAILISCLGLLGLAAFTAQQRVREIGIRKVLGATVMNIITLLSRDFIKLVLVSVIIATPIAWWTMHSWLQDFAYHIPLSPWFLAGAGILALAIAVLTIASQSIRAARANPVKNLRSE
ncbi:MAG TPA: FtsX-like permease family protein, partial [Puia sp.]|nr:FtsX-like permease family protein [Puia sp.]